MFKKWLFLLLFLFSFLFIDFFSIASAELWNTTIKYSLIWDPKNDIINSNIDSDDWLTMLTSIFVWIKDSLTGLLVLIAIWAFLFIWIRLALAKWNPEEFKKGMMQLVYAIIWIFIVSIAWAAVKLVAWLTI